MATMAISTKARSVGALLLLLAVLVGTSAPGVTGLVPQLHTSILNLCPVNATVGISGLNTLNVTVGANGTVISLQSLLNLSSDLGIVLSLLGGPSNITVPVDTLVNELLALLSGILGGIGGILGGLLGNITQLFITTITINCSDTSCGTAGLLAANTSVTVVDTLLGLSAKVCV